MARAVPLLVCLVTASILAGCTTHEKGPLVPHGRLEVSFDRRVVTAHLDFHNKGDLPIEFPRHATGDALTAHLGQLILNSNRSERIEGTFLDGPTGVPGKEPLIFNGSDVIPPRSWWNTTFHVEYDEPLQSPWILAYSAPIQYREQNGTGYWDVVYHFPCYNADGTLNTTFAPKGCDLILTLSSRK